MAGKKYQKKYGGDMQMLLGALHGEPRTAFVAALAACSPDALEVFEQGRGRLTKPRRECVELFLVEAQTFEQIADRTGYLLDDILAHVVAGVNLLVPAASGEAATTACHSEPASPLSPRSEERVEGSHNLVRGDSSTRCRSVRNDSFVPPAAADNDGDTDLWRPLPERERGPARWPWIVLVILALAAVAYYIYISMPRREAPPVEQTVEVKEPVSEPVVVADSGVVSAVQSLKAGIASISREADGEYTSTPQIGWVEYDEYLSNAVMPLEEASRGDVTLTFLVNRYGRPSQIRVTSVLTHEANHEAIRLIANGPEWTESPRQVTVTIKFR